MDGNIFFIIARGRGEEGEGAEAEAMQQPAGTMRQLEGSATRGNSTTSRRNERPRGRCNERTRGQHNKRWCNNQLAQWEAKKAAQQEDNKRQCDKQLGQQDGKKEAQGEDVKRRCDNQPSRWDDERATWLKATQQPASTTRGQEGGSASLFVDLMNWKDAKQWSELELQKKRRVKQICFICMTEKNHNGIPSQSARLGGHLLFFVLTSPRLWQCIIGGANLAAWLIGVPLCNTSLGEVKLAAEEEEEDDKDKEGMERGQRLPWWGQWKRRGGGGGGDDNPDNKEDAISSRYGVPPGKGGTAIWQTTGYLMRLGMRCWRAWGLSLSLQRELKMAAAVLMLQMGGKGEQRVLWPNMSNWFNKARKVCNFEANFTYKLVL
jgi:hypothetical protein